LIVQRSIRVLAAVFHRGLDSEGQNEIFLARFRRPAAGTAAVELQISGGND
jgi:hypothetical protein